MSTIEALEGAIEMLTKIKKGGSYNIAEYIERLQSYEQARDAHRLQQQRDEKLRAQICTAAEQRRQRQHLEDERGRAASDQRRAS